MSRITWTGGLALAAFLAACAGGGGDGGGSCPAGSVLTVFPTSVRVTAGDPAVSFGAGVTNCTEDIRWSLSGPGSLDRNVGVPVNYTPPASVATPATATLTASVDTLAASATITIDPAVVALAGKVIATNGAPVEGATVRVGTSFATTDAAGAFSLSGISPPYGISATSPDGLLTSFYAGLRRMDPTLVVFDVAPAFPRSASVTGALSGGAGFPKPDGHEAGVAFRSPEAAGSSAVQAGVATYQLGASWSGPPAVTGALHALGWQVDADKRPVSYDGYGSRTGVALASGSMATGQDVALSAIGSSSVAGTILNAPSNSASISMSVVLGDGARLRILPPPGDPSPFPYSGYVSTFSIPTPVVAGATIDLVARQDYAGGPYQEVHRHGLAAGETGVLLAFGGPPIQGSPVNGTIIAPGQVFSWHTMPDAPVYVISFRGPSGSPGYDIFTTVPAFAIPADFTMPSSTSYTWLIRGSSAFATVEEAAGSGGFMAGAASYRIAQSGTWQFTTPP